jgi:hypothetical protein
VTWPPAKEGKQGDHGKPRPSKPPTKGRYGVKPGKTGPEAMGIRMERISLSHSLWSTQTVHRLHRLSTSHSIAYRLGVIYLLVIIDNSFPPEHSMRYLTNYRFSLPRLSTEQA